jgi:hypothetical protein
MSSITLKITPNKMNDVTTAVITSLLRFIWSEEFGRADTSEWNILHPK